MPRSRLAGAHGRTGVEALISIKAQKYLFVAQEALAVLGGSAITCAVQIPVRLNPISLPSNKIRGEDHGTTHTHPIDRNTGPTELSTPNEAKIHTDRLPKR